jgi:hypothetical protein
MVVVTVREIWKALARVEMDDRGTDEEYAATLEREWLELKPYRDRANAEWLAEEGMVEKSSLRSGGL